MFCNGSESHNILRFNGTNQWVNGKAELIPVKDKSMSPGYKIDLTPVYSGQMVSVQRGFNLRSDKSVLIQDEWQSGERGASVSWQMITFADVELKKNEVVLAQSGEAFWLKVVSDDVAHLSVQDVAGLLNVWDKPHPGLKRITIRLNSLPKSSGRLAIIASPSAKSEIIKPVQLLPLKYW